MTEREQAVRGAFETIFANLADCDFVVEHGTKALAGLTSYKEDMIQDVLKELERASA